MARRRLSAPFGAGADPVEPAADDPAGHRPPDPAAPSAAAAAPARGTAGPEAPRAEGALPPLETKAMPFGPLSAGPTVPLRGAGPSARPAARAPIAGVAGEASAMAALEALAGEMSRARMEGRIVQAIPLDEIDEGWLIRDRLAIDEEELALLMASLDTHGQRMPVELVDLSAPGGAGRGASAAPRPRESGEPAGQDPGATGPAAGTRTDAAGAGRAGTGRAAPRRYGLISGARRLMALRRLHDRTGEARFASVQALVRRPEAAGAAYVAMVEENEIRAGLSYYERARIAAAAVEAGAFPDRRAALQALYAHASRARRSKIGSFLAIHDALGDVLRHPAAIPERLGLALAARLGEPDFAAGLRDRLQDGLRDSRAAGQGEEAGPLTAGEEAAILAAALRPAAQASRASASAGASRASASAGSAAKRELAPGIWARPTAGGMRLEGPGIDAAFLARLEAWLRG